MGLEGENMSISGMCPPEGTSSLMRASDTSQVVYWARSEVEVDDGAGGGAEEGVGSLAADCLDLLPKSGMVDVFRLTGLIRSRLSWEIIEVMRRVIRNHWLSASGTSGLVGLWFEIIDTTRWKGRGASVVCTYVSRRYPLACQDHVDALSAYVI